MLNKQIYEIIFKKQVDDKTIIPAFSTDINCAYDIIKFHYEYGRWIFCIKALHYQDGNLAYCAIFRSNNLIAEQVAETIEIAICLAGLMVSEEKYIEYVENNQAISKETIITPPITDNNIIIENEYNTKIYKILLNCLKNIEITTKHNTNITISSLLEHALTTELISLQDMGNVLDSCVKSIINELTIYNLINEKYDNENK